MKTTSRLHPDPRHGRPAAEADGRRHRPAGVSVVDNRPAAAAERKLADSLGTSPHMLAQRKRLGSVFHPAAQLQAGPGEGELQMKAASELLQREVEEEELLQGKFEVGQRAVEEEELLQGKFEVGQRAVDEEEPLQGKFQVAQRAAGEEPPQNRTGMPDQLKAGIESLSGLDMSQVRVHYGSDRPARLNARAYAQGSDIHVAQGEEKHLPHEAWHVVQQAQGRVQPTMQLEDGVPVNDDQGLEREADVMGETAAGLHGD